MYEVSRFEPNYPDHGGIVFTVLDSSGGHTNGWSGKFFKLAGGPW